MDLTKPQKVLLLNLLLGRRPHQGQLDTLRALAHKGLARADSGQITPQGEVALRPFLLQGEAGGVRVTSVKPFVVVVQDTYWPHDALTNAKEQAAKLGAEGARVFGWDGETRTWVLA